MDVCKTLIVAALAAIMIQASERVSYDADHGLRLAAAPVAHAAA